MLQAPRIVRWTLPALLLTLVVGGYAIVSASGILDDAQPGSAVPAQSKKSKRHKAKSVLVHTGDTLASIARHAHLTTAALLELNPDVDPRLLSPGQRLKTAR